MDAKKLSKRNGKAFLRQAFSKQQEVLKANLEFAEYSITHQGKRGDVAEKYFIEILRSYLPNRYSIDSAIVIDSRGHTSDQIDIVIYDRQYTPTLLDQHEHKYVPAEAVYGIFEVKPEFNTKYLKYAAEKVESVRKLHRTSIEIPHAGGKFPSKPQIDFFGGLIAAKIDWADGFGKSFKSQLVNLKGKQTIECGLVVEGHCFDRFNNDGQITYGPNHNALIFFLFRILYKLQSFATVPAVDWNKYGSQLIK